MGNVGSITAKLLHQEGMKVVAVSDVSGGIYKKEGLDIPAILAYLGKDRKNLLSGYEEDGMTRITNEELLELPVTVLVPAALENQINGTNADKIQAKLIVEAANGPTAAEADPILNEKGVVIVPDILSNAGGVVVSYFEWVQNIQELTWERDRVNEMLENLMSKSFAEITEAKEKYDCTYRMAAYVVALKKLIYA